MTFTRAFRWSISIFVILSLLASICWFITGDGSWDIGVTFALIPNLLVALYLGYRMVRAHIADMMPFVAAVVTTVPAVAMGWTTLQGLRLSFGRTLGPMDVTKYAERKERTAVKTILRGRMLWKQGVGLTRARGGQDVNYSMIPFVPVNWRKGDPVHVWMLGAGHRLKQHDFDGCGYPKSIPCTVTAYEPRLRELRLVLIRAGVGSTRGGLNFVVLRADPNRGWLPRWLAVTVGPGWLLLLSLWIFRMGRKNERNAPS